MPETAKSTRIDTAEINGKPVTFFTPPHDEPDLPWVDVWELSYALHGDPGAADVTLKQTQAFGGPKRAYATARSGDRIVVISCHPMAQGLCGAVDHIRNGTGEDEDGPAFIAYSKAIAEIMRQHFGEKDLMERIEATKNAGGPFMRD